MTAPDKRPTPTLPAMDAMRRVHIVGLCGTAMGTLGAMFAERGWRVTGSDAGAYPPMSTWLEARGLRVLEGYDAAHVPDDVDLVVMGNVARRDNPESVAAFARGVPVISLPEALRLFFVSGRRGLVVTGTHGKTTTSSMAAWMLHEAGRDPSFFIGGVTGNFGSNYRLGDGDAFVVEGDEYDTAWFDKVPKFWHYPAAHATINNVEFDHADIYPDLDAYTHVFRRFAEQVPAGGTLWVNGDDPLAMDVSASTLATRRTFGLGTQHDLGAELLGDTGDGTRVRVFAGGDVVDERVLPVLGTYNVRNVLGAAGLVGGLGVPLDVALDAVDGFVPVQKRQQVKGVAAGVTVIDDFAHHPTAVRLTVEALRRRYPDGRLFVAFEIKSNTSRRAVFQHDYPAAFAAADVVVIGKPWRKDNLPPDQLLSVDRLVDDIRALGPRVELIPEVDDIVAWLADEVRAGDVVAGLAGSSFGGLHDTLLETLGGRDD